MKREADRRRHRFGTFQSKLLGLFGCFKHAGRLDDFDPLTRCGFKQKTIDSHRPSSPLLVYLHFDDTKFPGKGMLHLFVDSIDNRNFFLEKALRFIIEPFAKFTS